MEIRFNTKNLKYFFPPILILKLPFVLYREIVAGIRNIDWEAVFENFLVVMAILFIVGYPTFTIVMFVKGHWIIGLILSWAGAGFIWWVSESDL